MKNKAVLNNSRGDILLVILIAFGVLGATVAAIMYMMHARAAMLRRNNVMKQVNSKMVVLQRMLANPAMCEWAFRGSGLTLATWPDVTKERKIDHIEIDPANTSGKLVAMVPPAKPALLWNTGAQVGPDLTLSKITIRQPDSATYHGDPSAPAAIQVTRQATSPTSGLRSLTDYHVYLAKLTLYFTSSVTGGYPEPGTLWVNVERNDSTGAIEHCFPALGGINTVDNKLSMVNEMGAYCNASNSTPIPFKWNYSTNQYDGYAVVPTDRCPVSCNSYNLVGFDSNGVPECRCACLPSLSIGQPFVDCSATPQYCHWVCESPTFTWSNRQGRWIKHCNPKAFVPYTITPISQSPTVPPSTASGLSAPADTE